MRIVVVGATGVIGSAVATALAERGHEVLGASRHGAVRVDLLDMASIAAMYTTVGSVDAVVSCAGAGAFKPLAELTDEDITATFRSKVFGQMNLVRCGVSHIADGGVFVLTAGLFGQKPVPGAAALAMANGALEGFARAATLDLPRGLRVTTISPPWIKETAEKMGMSGGLPAAENAKSYVDVVEGREMAPVVLVEE